MFRNWFRIFCLFTLLSSPLHAQNIDPTAAISGMNVGVFSNTQLVIEPAISMWVYGANRIANLKATLYPDITTIGLNGMDRNPNGAGHPPPDGNYDLFAVYNPTTDDLGFIITMGDGSWADVIKPPGYDTAYRKIMVGILIHGGVLVPNHISFWPMPHIELTIPIDLKSFTPSDPGWGSWNTIQVPVPENARFGYFYAVITNGTANVFVSANSGPQYQRIMAYNGTSATGVYGCRIDHTQIYLYVQKGSGNPSIDFYWVAWDQTEVD